MSRAFPVWVISSIAIIIIAMVLIFAYRNHLDKVNRIEAEGIESAVLIFNEDDPIMKKVDILSRGDIEDIAVLINSPKQAYNDYSCSDDDACFLMEATMKEGGKRFYEFILKEKERVFMREKYSSGGDFSLQEWRLEEKAARKAFDTRAFRRIYLSSEPIFPIVYVEGIELLGSKTVDTWEYKNCYNQWRFSSFSPTIQEEEYTLQGNTVNILFPLYPKSREYAIYDSANRKIEGGMLTEPRIRLPGRKGNYRLELTAVWDHETLSQGDDPIEEQKMTNDFRGKTMTVIEFRCNNRPDLLDAAKAVEDHSLMVPLEATLERLGVAFSIDYEKKNCEIEDTNLKMSIEVMAREVRKDDLKRMGFNFRVGRSQTLRNFYFEDHIVYVDALKLAYDLGMVLKKEENGRYIYRENNMLYPMIYLKEGAGYIDCKGNWKISPIFDETEDFEGDYSIFRITDNAFDDVRIPVQASPYRESGESVDDTVRGFRNQVEGLIDLEGSIVITPGRRFNYLGENMSYSFYEDSLILSFLNESRKINIPFVFRPGMSKVEIGEKSVLLSSYRPHGEGSFYFDLEGNRLHEDPFDVAGPFSCGRAAVGKGGFYRTSSTKYGIIDTQFRFKVPYLFSHIYDYSENVALIQLCTNGINQYAYIDTEGNLLSDLDYEYATSFHDGRALVNWDEDYLTYINKKFEVAKTSKGEWIAKIKVDKSMSFRDIPDPYGYKREYLNYVFSEGFAVVPKGESYEYIDTMGNVVTTSLFSYGKPFKNGMASVLMKEGEFSSKESYINTFGEIIEITKPIVWSE